MKNSVPLELRNRVQNWQNIRLFCPVFLSIFISSLLAPAPGFAQDEVETPPFEYRKQQAGYFGPEGENPEPAGLEEITVAYFGPGDSAHPDYGDLWTALQIAEKQINSEENAGEKPIRFISVWTEDPWKGGISDMVRAIYEQDVWAMIGSVDSASTHLLEQVAAKARIPVINPISTDKSANLANVPWLFSLLPGDHILAEVLVSRIKELLAGNRDSFVLIAGTDHDSRLLSKEISSLLSANDMAPSFMFEYESGIPLPWDLIKKEPGLFIVIAPPGESSELVKEIHGRFPETGVFGGPFMGRNKFRQNCGEECEGVFYVSPGSCSPGSDFAEEFRGITGLDPDYADCGIYDAALLLRDSLNRSGLNRVLLLREIRHLTPWEGENGTITWDPLGQNIRKASLQAVSGTKISSPE